MIGSVCVFTQTSRREVVRKNRCVGGEGNASDGMKL